MFAARAQPRRQQQRDLRTTTDNERVQDGNSRKRDVSATTDLSERVQDDNATTDLSERVQDTGISGTSAQGQNDVATRA